MSSVDSGLTPVAAVVRPLNRGFRHFPAAHPVVTPGWPPGSHQPGLVRPEPEVAVRLTSLSSAPVVRVPTGCVSALVRSPSSTSPPALVPGWSSESFSSPRACPARDGVVVDLSPRSTRSSVTEACPSACSRSLGPCRINPWPPLTQPSRGARLVPSSALSWCPSRFSTRVGGWGLKK